MKLLAIDFEYKKPSNPGMGLISCVTYAGTTDTSTSVPVPVTRRFWLWDPLGVGQSDKDALIAHLLQIQKTHILVAYNIQQAEARCLAALGLNPNDFMWRDLMLEWRWLRNCDNRYNYGLIVTAQGFGRFTIPPVSRANKRSTQEEIEDINQENESWLQQAQAEADGDGTPHKTISLEVAGASLLDCLYFFEVIGIDDFRAAAATKLKMREGTIMACSDKEIGLHKNAILDYNAGDVGDMLRLADTLTANMVTVGAEPHCIVANGEFDYVELGPDDIAAIQRRLGDWAARVAKYAYRGIPVNEQRLKRLLEAVPAINEETIADWIRDNPLNPIYRVGLPDQVLGLKKQMLEKSPYIKGKLSADMGYLEDLIKRYCVENGVENWPRTKTGRLDTSKKTIEKYASEGNILKAYARHKNMLSTLKAFTEVNGKIEALDYIGSDYRQRPDFNPWGTQTARNAHKTKSLIPANTHVFRFLIDPPEGKAIVALDYGSEEVWIAACNGGDQRMKDAYLSSDYYIAYAQLTGMYPAELRIPNEEERGEEWFKPYEMVRSAAKTLCLGMSFGAGFKSVAASVRAATKDETIDEDWGRNAVNEYKETFSEYTRMTERIKEEYREHVPQILPNGWRLGTDKQSALSAANLPTQGRGSVILQEACKRLDDEGIEVIFTMHDEIAALCNDDKAEQVAKRMAEIMLDAAEFVLGERGMKIGAPEIIRHGKWWTDHSGRARKGWKLLEKYFLDLLPKK